ncbi:protein FAR1-related sequence 5 [Tanacetum coccineum]
MAVFDLNQPASSLSEEDDVAASSSINTGFDSHVVSVSSSINTGCDSFASHDDIASYTDAQMLITMMEQMQEFTKDFYFDYFVKDAELCGLFWADEVAKCNYKEFGDIVSFDATYKTNKYKMVFVHFTAIDNHRRSVTVGSGLLKKETAKAYGWLLRAFKKAFVRPPNIVVTDQDGAMRLAVATRQTSDEGCNVCIIDEEKVKPVGTREVIDKENQYILRRWTRDLIPLHLRNKKNRYAEKNEAIEKLAIEASIIVDSCIHMLRNNEQKLSVFVNKMKALKSEVEVNLPIVPTRTVFFDLVQEFMGVKKPDKIKVKNPNSVRPKGLVVPGGGDHVDGGLRDDPFAVVVPGDSDHVDGGLRGGASGSVLV